MSRFQETLRGKPPNWTKPRSAWAAARPAPRVPPSGPRTAASLLLRDPSLPALLSNPPGKGRKQKHFSG